MAFIPQKTKHWYSTWWGVTILVASVLIAAAIMAFGLLIFSYWREVKSGNTEYFRQKFYQQAQQAEDPKVTALREVLETTDDPYLGNVSAQNVIVEFIDHKCPICKVQTSVMQQVAAKYGYALKIITRDFPMESVHEGTTQYAAIASCAHEQGGYSLVSNLFFSNQDVLPTELSSDEIGNMSDSFGLDKAKMLECVNSGRGRTEVMEDYSDAIEAGLAKGTPTYFVNGYMLEGAVPFASWEELFQKMGLAN